MAKGKLIIICHAAKELHGAVAEAGDTTWETHTQHNVHDKKHHNVAIDGGRSRKSKSLDRAVQEIWQNSCN